MPVVLALVGIIVGGLAALFNDFSINTGALLGAALGFGLGYLLNRKSPAPDALAAVDARVQRLERDVRRLESQLAQLRGDEQSVKQVADDLRNAQPPAATVSAAVQPATKPDSVPVPARSVMPATDAADRRERYQLKPQPTVKNDSTVGVGDFDLQPAAKPVVSPQPAQKATPTSPGIAQRLFNYGRDWLLGGNTVVRVGMLVLLFGVAFLLKYASENVVVPIEFRLAGVAIGAVALLGIGWRVGARRGAYGLVMQGGGVGVLYLTMFAATRLYSLLPVAAAFPLMVAVCGLSAFLAVRQNALPLAFMGSAGGFLAPVLLASGGGSHVALFSYYALLNAGIVAIAWFKAWRPLNLLGFVFTFVIGTAWGATAYRPEMFWSTEPFLILFFVMYVGVAILYAVRREVMLKHYVDGTLVFGTPIIVLGLQAGLTQNIQFGLAWSAVGFAAFYLAVAACLTRLRARLALFYDTMVAIAVLFATLALPLAFTFVATSGAWALEGAAIVWLALRQRRIAPLWFGLIMQLAAYCAFLAGLQPKAEIASMPVINGFYVATVLLAGAALFTGWCLHARSTELAWLDWLKDASVVAAVCGLLWWIGGGVSEIYLFVPRMVNAAHVDRWLISGYAIFAVLTAWLCHLLGRRLKWRFVGGVAFGLAPVVALCICSLSTLNEAPLSGWGTSIWPLVVAATYLLLRRQESELRKTWLDLLHTLTFWSVSGLFAQEAYWLVHAYVPEGTWSWSAWACGGALILLLLSTVGSRLRWPVARYEQAYLVWGATPVALLLWWWSVQSAQLDGAAAPLPWLPLLNPLDVAQLFALLGIAVWLRRLRALGVTWRPFAFDYAVLATIFFWFNALMLRAVHFWFHEPYAVDSVLSSFRLQQIFLAGWCAFAFAGMGFARRGALARLLVFASTPLVIALWGWSFYANLTQDGGAWSRWPLFNPLDLGQLAIFGVAALWIVRLRDIGVPVREFKLPLVAVSIGAGFFWLNTVLLRTLHHWFDVPYVLDDLLHSQLVQASLSVFWTVCALAAMLWASRVVARNVWFVGAALLAVTVAKLFLFDLAHVHGVERIVSFIGVGVMLLLIGYFSPLPPKRQVTGEAQP